MIDIESEQKEYDEICQANADLSKQQAQLTRRLDQLKTEMAALQVEVEKEKQSYETALAEYEAENEKKQARLKIYQNLLGLTIETVRGKTSRDKLFPNIENVMQFNFKLIDPQSPQRIFSVTIDVNGDHYLVTDCSPALPELPSILASLNQSRDFYGFIKTIRTKFRLVACP